ncbi:MAG: hypothetical protein AAGF83_12070 [Cyanobacteria bacterium P01_G01_bin.67]
MSNFLNRLVEKNFQQTEMVQPRPLSLFETALPELPNTDLASEGAVLETPNSEEILESRSPAKTVVRQTSWSKSHQPEIHPARADLASEVIDSNPRSSQQIMSGEINSKDIKSGESSLAIEGSVDILGLHQRFMQTLKNLATKLVATTADTPPMNTTQQAIAKPAQKELSPNLFQDPFFPNLPSQKISELISNNSDTKIPRSPDSAKISNIEYFAPPERISPIVSPDDVLEPDIVPLQTSILTESVKLAETLSKLRSTISAESQTSQISPLNKSAAPRFTNQPKEQQAPSNIQITIGRIDVRANSQPKQLARKSRAKQSVMSLGEYLHRRSIEE